MLKEFSHHLSEARSGYRRFMAQDDDENVEQAFSRLNLPAILGGKEFVGKVKDRFFLAKTNREVPTARHLAPTVRDVLDAVLVVYQTDEATLSVSRRGTTNEPRDVAIYLLRTLCGQPLQQIAGVLSVRTYSTVSTTLTRVEKRLAEDEEFKKNVGRVRALITKSQSDI